MKKFLSSYDNVRGLMLSKGYKFYENDIKPYNLNIIGWRTDDMESYTYNDYMTVSWKYKGSIHHHVFQCTTDPGLYYLKNPMQVAGTKIMKPGQYLNAYKLCGHGYDHGCKGHGSKKRKCLREVKPINFYQDGNRDGKYDLDDNNVVYVNASANIHDPWGEKEEGDEVGKDSAACQVLVSEHYDILIGNDNSFVSEAIKYWNNSFTYTLNDWNDVNNYIR